MTTRANGKAGDRFAWVQRDNPCWPYEVDHGGFKFYLRFMGTPGGKPRYCFETEPVHPTGMLKFGPLASLKRLRRMSKREVYARLAAYCAFLSIDFEVLRAMQPKPSPATEPAEPAA